MCIEKNDLENSIQLICHEHYAAPHHSQQPKGYNAAIRPEL